jgi:hypothetical protein
MSGCEDPQGFVDPQQFSQRFIDLYNAELNGQSKLVYRVAVLPEPEMVHPHIEGRWTFTDPEKPIDVYIIPAAYYDDSRPPAEQDSVFWASVTGAEVDQQRATSVQVHPTPGDWVVVLYNALPFAATSRARFSMEIALTFFK